jgi:hypothetical protein
MHVQSHSNLSKNEIEAVRKERNDSGNSSLQNIVIGTKNGGHELTGSMMKVSAGSSISMSSKHAKSSRSVEIVQDLADVKSKHLRTGSALGAAGKEQNFVKFIDYRNKNLSRYIPRKSSAYCVRVAQELYRDGLKRQRTSSMNVSVAELLPRDSLSVVHEVNKNDT